VPITDRRELEFDVQTVRLVLEWSPRAAQAFGLPPLTPQAPWHGYSLGLWDAAWDTYAQRAVTGAWEQSGTQTFAARRSGLKAETPVRDVADPSRGME